MPRCRRPQGAVRARSCLCDVARTPFRRLELSGVRRGLLRREERADRPPPSSVDVTGTRISDLGVSEAILRPAALG